MNGIKNILRAVPFIVASVTAVIIAIQPSLNHWAAPWRQVLVILFTGGSLTTIAIVWYRLSGAGTTYCWYEEVPLVLAVYALGNFLTKEAHDYTFGNLMYLATVLWALRLAYGAYVTKRGKTSQVSKT